MPWKKVFLIVLIAEMKLRRVKRHDLSGGDLQRQLKGGEPFQEFPLRAPLAYFLIIAFPESSSLGIGLVGIKYWTSL